MFNRLKDLDDITPFPILPFFDFDDTPPFFDLLSNSLEVVISSISLSSIDQKIFDATTLPKTLSNSLDSKISSEIKDLIKFSQ